MADDKSKRGKPDRTRINLSQAHERRYWCRKFKCTPIELMLATKLSDMTFNFSNARMAGQELELAREQLVMYRRAGQRKGRRKP